MLNRRLFIDFRCGIVQYLWKLILKRERTVLRFSKGRADCSEHAKFQRDLLKDFCQISGKVSGSFSITSSLSSSNISETFHERFSRKTREQIFPRHEISLKYFWNVLMKYYQHYHRNIFRNLLCKVTYKIPVIFL